MEVYTNNQNFFATNFGHTLPPIHDQTLEFADASTTYRLFPLTSYTYGSARLQVDLSNTTITEQQLLEQVESELGIDVVKEENKSLLPHYFSRSTVILLLAAIVTLFVFITFFVWQEARNLSILRLQGKGGQRQLAYLIRNQSLSLLIGALMHAVLLYFYILVVQKIAIYYFYQTLAVSVLLLLCILLLSQGILLRYIADATRAQRLVRRSSVLLTKLLVVNQVVMVVTLTTVIVSAQYAMSQQQDIAQKEQQSHSWERTKDYYTTELQYTGEVAVAIERQTSSYLEQVLTNLQAEQFPYFIIDASNYMRNNHLQGQPYYYELNSQYAVDPEATRLSASGQSIVMSPSYLLQHDVMPADERTRVLEQLQFDPNVRNVLVPKRFQQQEALIKKNYWESFVYKKLTVASQYQEPLAVHPNDLSVHVIYVDDGLAYFSYNQDIMGEQDFVIVDPLVEIETGNIDKSYLNYYFTNKIFFKNTDNQQATFLQLLPKAYRAIQVINLYDGYADRLLVTLKLRHQQNGFSAAIALVGISTLLLWCQLTTELNRVKSRVYYYQGIKRWRAYRLAVIHVNGVFITASLLSLAFLPTIQYVPYIVIFIGCNICGVGIMVAKSKN